MQEYQIMNIRLGTGPCRGQRPETQTSSALWPTCSWYVIRLLLNMKAEERPSAAMEGCDHLLYSPAATIKDFLLERHLRADTDLKVAFML